MEQHLDESTLEALASGRDDLVSDGDRAHAQDCQLCAESLTEACLLREQLDEALSDFAPSPLEVRSLVRDALRDADREKMLTASPERLALWTVLSLAACLLIVIQSGFRPVLTFTHALSQGATIARVLVGVTDALPPSVSVLALALALIGLACVMGLRSLVSSTALALLFSFSLAATQASALDLEGEWPDPLPRVSVSVDKVPASEALKVAAKAAGVGSVITLESDPLVSLNVRDVPLPDVIEAIVGSEDLAAKWTGSLLIVHKRETATPSVAQVPSKTAAIPSPVPPEKPDPNTLRSLGHVLRLGGPAEVPLDARATEAVAIGGSLVVDGAVDRDAVAVGGNVRVRGTVLGDVVAIGGDVELEPSAEVRGETLSIGGKVNSAPGAVVSHKKSSRKIGDPKDPWGQLGVATEPEEESFADTLSSHALRYLTVFLFGLLLLAFAPERFQRVKSALRERPGRALLVGLLFAFTLPMLLIVLCITIIGIPVAILVALLVWALMYVALGGAASVIGGALPLAMIRSSAIGQLAIGALVLFALSFVPVIGTLCMAIAVLMGFGAVVLISRPFAQRL